jgi:hypothetical protein
MEDLMYQTSMFKKKPWSFLSRYMDWMIGEGIEIGRIKTT